MFATTLIYGFAVFSMFFGSGNLVFPISIGLESDHNVLAACGLAISAIFIPMLGLISRVKSGQGVMAYFHELGPMTAHVLVFLMMLLLGPLGVLPRCILVASGGLELSIPDLPFALSGALICVATYFLSESKNTVQIIGKVFTPVLLGGIVCVIVMGIYRAKLSAPNSGNFDIFFKALSTGYQTMDLIAAFFFADALVKALRISKVPDQTVSQITLRSIYVGFFCLLITYLLMIQVSSLYAPLLEPVEPQMRIAKITELVLGPHALIFSSILIAIACLTTLAVLLNEFVQYVCDVFQIECRRLMVITVLLFSYAWSFLGFSLLKLYLGMILEIFYPALMAYSVLKLLPCVTRFGYRMIFLLVALVSSYFNLAL